MAKMYYAKDCDINYLNGKKIAIIGYGPRAMPRPEPEGFS